MGYSLMVEQRTLTPYILVRVQVSQPIKAPSIWTVFYWMRTSDENQDWFGEQSARWRRFVPMSVRTVPNEMRDQSCVSRLTVQVSQPSYRSRQKGRLVIVVSAKLRIPFPD